MRIHTALVYNGVCLAVCLLEHMLAVTNTVPPYNPRYTTLYRGIIIMYHNPLV